MDCSGLRQSPTFPRLPAVAAVTKRLQIAWLIRASVLLGHDVVDVPTITHFRATGCTAEAVARQDQSTPALPTGPISPLLSRPTQCVSKCRHRIGHHNVLVTRLLCRPSANDSSTLLLPLRCRSRAKPVQLGFNAFEATNHRSLMVLIFSPGYGICVRSMRVMYVYAPTTRHHQPNRDYELRPWYAPMIGCYLCRSHVSLPQKPSGRGETPTAAGRDRMLTAPC